MIPTLRFSCVSEIDLAGAATPPALFARDELMRYLEMILGQPTRPGDGNVIQLAIDPQSGLSEEGYEWDFDGNGVRIAAGGDLGLVFGVYAFLREVCGCRFCGLGPDGEFVPRLDELAINLAPTRREPRLWYRSIQFYYFEHPSLYQQVIDWMAKNGFNYVLFHFGTEHDALLRKEQVDPQTGARLFPEQQGPSMFDEEYFNRYLLPEIRKRGLKLDFNHHNLCYWVPPARHVAKHPEWFAEIDGKRAASFTQLCLCTSNPEVVGELIRHVKEFLRAHPEVRIVGILPEDGRGMCQCESCLAMDVDPKDAFEIAHRDYRDPTYENRSIVRRYALLLNKVARAVRDEFPRVLVCGQAYIDLQWPPRDVTLEDNIAFQIAVYWRDGARPLAAENTSERNRFFFDLIRRWRGRLKGPLLLYEYYMGMHAQRSLPYPMTRVIAQDWRHLSDVPVDGATIQCTAGSHEAYSLNLLAFSQCAWGQAVDADRLLDDYVQSLYGTTAKAIRPIFRGLLEAGVEWPQAKDQLLPDAKNIAYFWQRLGAGHVWDCIDSATKLAATERERRQINRLAGYLKYCELAARAMATQIHFEQVEKNNPNLAAELRARLGERELPAVIDYLETTRIRGWILPQLISRWKSDLARVTTEKQVVQTTPPKKIYRDRLNRHALH